MLKKHYKKILAVFLIAVLAIGAVFLNNPIDANAAESYTKWVGNWRGRLYGTYSNTDGGTSTITLIAYIHRNTGTLVEATYTARIGTSAGASNTATLSKKMTVGKSSYKEVGRKTISVARTHSAQSFTYYGSFRYKASTTSDFYNTGGVTITIPADQVVRRSNNYCRSYNKNRI